MSTLPRLSPLLQVETETREQEHLRTAFCPRYRVILHNDDVHDMLEVVEALVKSIPGLQSQEAVKIMQTAHETGSAVVVVCPRETAEYYQERLLSFGLTVTIEPD